MNSSRSEPFHGKSIICLAHSNPQKALSENKPAFILFYKNGVCCSIASGVTDTREEAHMDFSSILMKYDIDLDEYDVPDWGWPW